MTALYDRIGEGYSGLRRADPRIAAQIYEALGPPARLLNLGAGTGNYELSDREVIAVEPSGAMIRQRPSGAAPVVQATASALPFARDAFAQPSPCSPSITGLTPSPACASCAG